MADEGARMKNKTETKAKMLPIDFTPVTNRQQVYLILRRIKTVDYAVGAGSQSEVVAASQAMMGKVGQSAAHVVYLSLDPSPLPIRQTEKHLVKPGIINLLRARPDASGLTHTGAQTRSHFFLGAFDTGLKFFRKLQLIFQGVLQPFLDLPLLRHR